jgi:hypothetical protein
MRSCPSQGYGSGFKKRGQALLEAALVFPVLLVVLSGMFEFGFLLNEYIAVQDSTRNAARFASDSDYTIPEDGNPDCTGSDATTFFYRQTACLAKSELQMEQPTIVLCLVGTESTAKQCPRASEDLMDDVIVSVFSIFDGVATRFPAGTGENGWSYYADINGISQGAARSPSHISNFTTTEIETNRVISGLVKSSVVIVELRYHYYQVLALPWFKSDNPVSPLHDPILFQAYASWPQSSAVPSDTP